jgi:exosortase D (VPLPA-CTERM-specific)
METYTGSTRQDTMLGSKNSYLVCASLLFVSLLLGIVYGRPLWRLALIWIEKPEYSHGFLIPIVSIYLIWHRKSELHQIGWHGSWAGVFFVLLSVFMVLVAKFAFEFLIYYSFMVMLAGLTLSLWSWRGLRVIWISITFLIFMIPLPHWLYSNISGKLQLISSGLGVEIIKAFGISVFQEGNVIDLGNYKLQVQEACDGLRYLFPLMSFTFLCAYLFNIKLWMRIIVFLSCIPIAIFMNSTRIGITGLLIEQGKIELAEGFFHYFEGWIIFMASVAILVGEVWLLAKLGGIGSLRSVLKVDFQKQKITHYNYKAFSLPGSYLAVLSILIISVFLKAGLSMPLVDSKMPPVNNPPRIPFASFPIEIGEWNGERLRLQSWELDLLKPNDYLFADYREVSGERVNLYAAYWSNRSRVSERHLPQVCIPGSGWQILNNSSVAVEGVSISGDPLIANRLLIEKSGDRRIVYYWSLQCGRLVSGHLLRRWYRFWDRLSQQRTDHAFVRLITPVSSIEDWQAGDERIVAFSKTLYPKLDRYIPPSIHNH